MKAITAEIRKYVPEVPGRVKYFIPHQNDDAPLFVNDVGVWDHRPTNVSRIPGVYLAGDFVRHTTEVASMEGAVRSGLDAAEAIRLRHAADTPSVDILPPVHPGEAWLAKYRRAMPFIRAYAWLRWRVPEYFRFP